MVISRRFERSKRWNQALESSWKVEMLILSLLGEKSKADFYFTPMPDDISVHST